MQWKYKNLESRINKLENDNLLLKRILENYKPGKITYKSYEFYTCKNLFGVSAISYCRTYIYKDGKEYYLGDVPLKDPKLKVIDEDTIMIKENFYKRKYIFQFSTSKLMEVEWEKSKEESNHMK